MRDKLALAVVLGIVLVQSALAGSISFKPVQSYTVGTNPVAIVVGDFNGDGKVDLAVANSGDPSTSDNGGVSILLGNGDGTFQSATNVSVGKNPAGIAVGDFNSDSRLDIVVADSVGVSILLGNGDGTFHAGVSHPDPQLGSVWVGAHDLNGDNRLDLVVNGAVLLGNGDGSFQEPIGYATTGSGAVAVADLNGDGRTDLALPGGAVLLGNGDGTFRQGWVSPRLLVFAWTSNVGDLNGDGRPDLIVQGPTYGNGTASALALLLNNGDGTFFQGKSVATAACQNSRPVTADFDGDGKLDLLVLVNDHCFPHTENNPRLLVMGGNGDGTFQTPVTVGGSLLPLLAADLDRNQSPDVVAVNAPFNTISILLNTAGTDFSIMASALSPNTVSAGQSATSTLSLNLLNAFDGPVSLSCSVQPALPGTPSCAITPRTVTFDGSGKAASKLTITAGTSAAFLNQPLGQSGSLPWHWPWPPVAGFALVGTGLARNNARRRQCFSLLAGSALFAGLISLAACGGNDRGGPKSQPYSIMVTGTSGITQHSTMVSFTVQ